MKEIIERLETRKRNTEKAIDDMEKIVDFIDNLKIKNFYFESQKFTITKYIQFSDGGYTRDRDAKFILANGFVNIIFYPFENDEVETLSFKELRALDYFNFRNAVSSLLNLLEKLKEINVYDKEQKILNNICKLIN